jgi:hypothetical protein
MPAGGRIFRQFIEQCIAEKMMGIEHENLLREEEPHPL